MMSIEKVQEKLAKRGVTIISPVKLQAIKEIIDEEYNRGYNNGHDDAYDDVYNDGYNEGYRDGYAECEDDYQ